MRKNKKKKIGNAKKVGIERERKRSKNTKNRKKNNKK